MNPTTFNRSYADTLVGKLVVLKSGGPFMVVERVAEDGLLECALWRNGTVEIDRAQPWTVRRRRWWEFVS